MDGDACPGTELNLGEPKSVTYHRERVERNRVEDEDRSHRNADLAFSHADYRSDRRDGRPTGNRGARGDQNRDLAIDAQLFAKGPAFLGKLSELRAHFAFFLNSAVIKKALLEVCLSAWPRTTARRSQRRALSLRRTLGESAR